MPDIELRFNKDMLVLSAPLDAALARQGIDAARDRQYLNLMEQDAVIDAFRYELMAGAQCLVTTTEDITRARLAHVRMENDFAKLAHAAVSIAADLKPQHVLAEIGPCGLPLDPSSKTSLNENRGQYAQAARAFDGESIDSLFLNGFTNLVDMKCALMGVAQVSGLPVFASMTIGDRATEPVAVPSSGGSVDGDLGGIQFGEYTALEIPDAAGARWVSKPLAAEKWPEAVAAMEDLGASVIGFETADPLSKAVAYAQQAVAATALPILAQVHVSDERAGSVSPLVPLSDIDEYTADTMAQVAVKLYGAGVQFLRATGAATSAFTGALAATVAGLDVRVR